MVLDDLQHIDLELPAACQALTASLKEHHKLFRKVAQQPCP